MKRIVLPKTQLEISQLAYGTGSFDGSFPIEDGLRLMARYVEAGGNFLDTAHCYCFWIDGAGGASERFVGAAAKEFGRDNLVLATKGGHIGMNGYPRPDAFIGPDIVRQDLDESLDRLGLSTVDIYYLRRDDPRVPVGEIIEAVNERTTSGRVRYLGASNWSVDRYLAANEYATAHGLHPFVILQNQWSLARPDWTDLTSPGAIRCIEDDEVPKLVESRVAVAAFSPTANGYFATNGLRGKQFESEQTRCRLSAVAEVAKARGATPSQIALAYLLDQPSLVFPVLGTRDESHLMDALGATVIGLTFEELRFLRA